MRHSLASLLCGTLFGLGLAVSGMTDTHRVLGFLDVMGVWDPALALVMGGAVAVTLTGFRVVLRRPMPLFAGEFHLPQKTRIDGRLIMGAACFGVGWGVYGYCPGPAISALTYGRMDTVLFVGAMLAGMWIAAQLKPRPAGGVSASQTT